MTKRKKKKRMMNQKTPSKKSDRREKTGHPREGGKTRLARHN